MLINISVLFKTAYNTVCVLPVVKLCRIRESGNNILIFHTVSFRSLKSFRICICSRVLLFPLWWWTLPQQLCYDFLLILGYLTLDVYCYISFGLHLLQMYQTSPHFPSLGERHMIVRMKRDKDWKRMKVWNPLRKEFSDIVGITSCYAILWWKDGPLSHRQPPMHFITSLTKVQVIL